MENQGRSIGLFDSGVGGLTVLKALRDAFPAESTIYIGDNARVPYGPLPVETIQQYTLQCLDYLYARGAKALVIACNTATAAALDVAQARYDVPVVGVIDPTAEVAASTASERVGIMATQATVESGRYPSAIKALNPSLEVVQQPCPLLTPLVEAGEIGTLKSETVLDGYLQPLRQHRVDTVVLGCTHYPFLRASVQKLMGSEVKIVESGQATAAVLERLMAEGKLAKAEGGTLSHRLLTTGNPEAFGRLAAIQWPRDCPPVEVVSVEGGNG